MILQAEIATHIKNLSAADAQTQEDAVDALITMGETAVDALIEAVNDGDATVCGNAIEALGRIGDPRALGTLIIALQDSDTNIIIAAMNALRRIGDPMAIQPLINFLSVDDLYLHFYATHSLSQINHPDTVDALLYQLENNNDPNVRHGCIVALGRLGDQRAITPILPLLRNASEKLRYSAVYALGDLATVGDPDVIAAITPLTNDPDSNVRAAAGDALKKLTSPA